MRQNSSTGEVISSSSRCLLCGSDTAYAGRREERLYVVMADGKGRQVSTSLAEYVSTEVASPGSVTRVTWARGR